MSATLLLLLLNFKITSIYKVEFSWYISTTCTSEIYNEDCYLEIVVLIKDKNSSQ